MKYLIFLLALTFSKVVFPAISEYEMKATYLYNFIAFTEWPNMADTKQINVCLLGQDNFGQSIKTIQGKKINDIPIAVSRISSLTSIKKCHLLFVAEKEAFNLKHIYSELENAPVLVVTDTSVPSGAMVNLYIEGDRLMFEINRARANSAGLRISSKVLQYARPMLIQE